MDTPLFLTLFQKLQALYPTWRTPSVTLISDQGGDPFKVLVSTILSLRTKDETTIHASQRLFALADDPEAMARLSPEAVEKAIYPVGFYKNKAVQIIDLCRRLTEEYGGRVPETVEELLAFKGVGRKTANLVVAKGHHLPAVCVDIHVHRICGRLGFIRAKDPDETEMRLRKKVPKEYWIALNDVLVAFGQTLCRPVSPRCSACPIAKGCEKKGVKSSR